ncbi:hypothetical protein RFI_19631 [Reticulomyxa filosa]|uniref:Uncharacterized protein n=1 Tax=Reticulomyxa filosa TaxID=46433 RepID=X6MVL1_RETFI|nr:hypothetical protein RFI_19631 [Reticulomyxa filosa]|eukprot:ETO17686.1 hypothetical protein RFI_19631 [Reticulomyxa filosa]
MLPKQKSSLQSCFVETKYMVILLFLCVLLWLLLWWSSSSWDYDKANDNGRGGIAEVQIIRGYNDNNNNNNDYNAEIITSNGEERYNTEFDVNEIARKGKWKGYDYANEKEERRNNFEKELKENEEIGKRLLKGEREAYKNKEKYYVDPEIYKEYTREYIQNEWKNKKGHVNEKYLKGGHPSCPIIESKDSVLSKEDKNIEKIKKMTTT